jgi:hypothetical protein
MRTFRSRRPGMSNCYVGGGNAESAIADCHSLVEWVDA